MEIVELTVDVLQQWRPYLRVQNRGKLTHDCPGDLPPRVQQLLKSEEILVPVETAGDGACGIHSTWCTGSRWNRAKGRNELFCANARSNAKNALEQISQNTMSHTATLVCTELWNDGGKPFSRIYVYNSRSRGLFTILIVSPCKD